MWRYHGLLTDQSGPLLQVEACHRGHAIVEQVIADLKASAVAHLPSGKFTANAAWLALAAIAHNLTRALGALAGHGLANATTSTLRRTLLRLPGRLARSGRRLDAAPARRLALADRRRLGPAPHPRDHPARPHLSPQPHPDDRSTEKPDPTGGPRTPETAHPPPSRSTSVRTSEDDYRPVNPG